MKLGNWLLSLAIAIFGVLVHLKQIELPYNLEIEPFWIMAAALGLVAFGNIFKVRDYD